MKLLSMAAVLGACALGNAEIKKLNPVLGNDPINRVTYLNSGVGFALSDKGEVYRSEAGKDTWDLVQNLNTGALNDIQFVNDTLGFIVGGIDVSTRGYLFRTQDAGKHWERLSSANCYANIGSASQCEFIYLRTLHFVNEKLGFVSGGRASNNGRVYRTQDGGNSWEEIATIGGYNAHVEALYFHNEKEGVALHDPDGLFYTSDGGETWMPTDTLTPSWSSWGFYFENEKVGYVTGQKQVLKTTDGGLTWNPFAIPSEINYVKSITGNESSLFLSGEQGVFAYDKEKKSWSSLYLNESISTSSNLSWNQEGLTFFFERAGITQSLKISPDGISALQEGINVGRDAKTKPLTSGFGILSAGRILFAKENFAIKDTVSSVGFAESTVDYFYQFVDLEEGSDGALFLLANRVYESPQEWSDSPILPRRLNSLMIEPTYQYSFLFRSLDGGKTWSNLEMDHRYEWTDLSLLGNQSYFVRGLTGNYSTGNFEGIFRTGFLNHNFDGNTDRVVSADGEKLTWVRAGDVFTSVDAGATWLEQTSAESPYVAYALHDTEEGSVWFESADSTGRVSRILVQDKDTGVWESLLNPFGLAFFAGVYRSEAGVLFAYGTESFYSLNMGKTWYKLPVEHPILNIEEVAGTLFFMNGNVVLRAELNLDSLRAGEKVSIEVLPFAEGEFGLKSSALNGRRSNAKGQVFWEKHMAPTSGFFINEVLDSRFPK